MLTKETLLHTKNTFNKRKNTRPQNLKQQSSNPRTKIAKMKTKTKTHRIAKTANPKTIPMTHQPNVSNIHQATCG